MNEKQEQLTLWEDLYTVPNEELERDYEQLTNEWEESLRQEGRDEVLIMLDQLIKEFR